MSDEQRDVSDLDQLVAFFEGAGYKRTDKDLTDGSPAWSDPGSVYQLDDHGMQVLNPGGHDPLIHYATLTIGQGHGYNGFIACFYFAEDGNLVGHGVWE